MSKTTELETKIGKPLVQDTVCENLRKRSLVCAMGSLSSGYCMWASNSICKHFSLHKWFQDYFRTASNFNCKQLKFVCRSVSSNISIHFWERTFNPFRYDMLEFARILLICSCNVGLCSRLLSSWENQTISSWLSLQANLYWISMRIGKYTSDLYANRHISIHTGKYKSNVSWIRMHTGKYTSSWPTSISASRERGRGGRWRSESSRALNPVLKRGSWRKIPRESEAVWCFHHVLVVALTKSLYIVALPYWLGHLASTFLQDERLHQWWLVLLWLCRYQIVQTIYLIYHLHTTSSMTTLSNLLPILLWALELVLKRIMAVVVTEIVTSFDADSFIALNK